jgi:hypothetical protein
MVQHLTLRGREERRRGLALGAAQPPCPAFSMAFSITILLQMPEEESLA